MVLTEKWERIDVNVFRTRVPGGWLVRTDGDRSAPAGLIFMPDQKHEWKETLYADWRCPDCRNCNGFEVDSKKVRCLGCGSAHGSKKGLKKYIIMKQILGANGITVDSMVDELDPGGEEIPGIVSELLDAGFLREETNDWGELEYWPTDKGRKAFEKKK